MKNMFILLIIFVLSGTILIASEKWVPAKNDKNAIDFANIKTEENTVIYNPEIKKEWRPYLYNSDLYDISLELYPDNRLLISKSIKIQEIKYTHFLITYNTSDVLYKISDKMDDVISSLKLIKTGDINNRFNIYLYDVSKYGGNDLILVGDKDKIIWKNSDNLLTDVKELSQNEYIIHSMCTIDYIHVLDNYQIIERYSLPFGYINSNHTGIRDPYPVSGTILTDNIIRLEYEDGAVEHWKVRLSKEDVGKNIEAAKKVGLSEGKIINSKRNSLIWWNGMGKGSPINHDRIKIWNYDDNPTREPVYENML